MPTNLQNITAVILTGGEGSRIGGVDKGLIKLSNLPLIQHLLKRVQPQVSNIIISANRNIDSYKALGFPVYEDETKDYAGPLAGIVKAMQHCETDWLLVVPADSPFIPADLASRLEKKMGDKKIAIPHDGQYLHPTFALLHKSLQGSLENYLASGERKARVWMQQQPHKVVDFSDQADAFININTEEELKNAEKHLQSFMA